MEKKEVKMVPNKTTAPANEKLSYEQLENVCHQLSEQSRTLYQKLQEANMNNLFKRLDYLFAVIDNKDAFPEDFITKCVNEIMVSMTIPEETEEKEEEK